MGKTRRGGGREGGEKKEDYGNRKGKSLQVYCKAHLWQHEEK